MKNILIVLLTVVATVAMGREEGVEIFKYDENENIASKDDFINSIDNSRVVDLSYDLIGSNTIKLQSKDISVKSYKFKGWDGDPGYNVIEFSSGDNVIYKYISTSGIITFNHMKGGYYGRDLRQHANNDFYIDYPIKNGNILLFIGHSYSTSQPQLVIFTVTDNGVNLVFDKKYRVSNIVKNKEVFIITIESQSKQLVSMNPDKWSDPVTHTIWLEDGVLKFKDNN